MPSNCATLSQQLGATSQLPVNTGQPVPGKQRRFWAGLKPGTPRRFNGWPAGPMAVSVSVTHVYVLWMSHRYTLCGQKRGGGEGGARHLATVAVPGLGPQDEVEQKWTEVDRSGQRDSGPREQYCPALSLPLEIMI